MLLLQRPERHGLNDRARIYVRGGGGGQGSPRFGGMGGDGGDVIVKCLPYGDLRHFAIKENRRIIAEHGTSFRWESPCCHFTEPKGYRLLFKYTQSFQGTF